MLCQMSKYFGKCFGPSTPAPESSFWLRCPSFLLSKFVSQWKLIQSVVRGLGYLESEWLDQFSGPCSQDFGSQSSNFQFLITYFQGPGCQGPMSQSPNSRVLGVRVPCSRVPESQGPGSYSPESQGPKSQGPRARVSSPNFRLCRKL